MSEVSQKCRTKRCSRLIGSTSMNQKLHIFQCFFTNEICRCRKSVAALYSVSPFVWGGVNEKKSRLGVPFVTQTLSDGEWRRKWKLRVRRIRSNQNKPSVSTLLAARDENVGNFRVFWGPKNHTFSTLRWPSTHQKICFLQNFFYLIRTCMNFDLSHHSPPESVWATNGTG